MSGMISSLAKRNMKALASAIGATLIGFVQSGIGAVLRSILEKMRETVSAQDFGVAGDGTDETTKMQKALDSLTQGGTLICPPNATILISAQLTFKPNTRLELNGATIKQKAGANTGDLMYVGASASGVTIRNGTIDINVVGQAYVGAKTDVGRAIFAYQAVGLRVEKVKFKNPYGSMILAASSSNIAVEKC
ncbi:hypothetical protein, partial [Janthinobacterium sp.]|uniref:hypothetical protein n=1 Tax=Janthinobacterium sp. TaxID=1871054 RepID=UPI0025908620